MQRLKKRAEKQVPVHDERAVGDETERRELHTASAGESYSEEHDYQGERKGKDVKDYIEGGYLKDIYFEDSYDETEYLKGDYPEEYNEVYEQDGYGEENGYAMEYEMGYQNVGYVQDIYEDEAYAEDIPQEEEPVGEFNPYTGKEYESNSVRMHPSRIGYVQVYDRSNHQWTDMTEWAFLGYQERKKQLLGKDYDPPIYLD